jgi:hypothetical protein
MTQRDYETLANEAEKGLDLSEWKPASAEIRALARTAVLAEKAERHNLQLVGRS